MSAAFLQEFCSSSCLRLGPQVPGIAALLHLTDAADISPVVGTGRCPSQQIAFFPEHCKNVHLRKIRFSGGMWQHAPWALAGLG